MSKAFLISEVSVIAKEAQLPGFVRLVQKVCDILRWQPITQIHPHGAKDNQSWEKVVLERLLVCQGMSFRSYGLKLRPVNATVRVEGFIVTVDPLNGIQV